MANFKKGDRVRFINPKSPDWLGVEGIFQEERPNSVKPMDFVILLTLPRDTSLPWDRKVGEIVLLRHKDLVLVENGIDRFIKVIEDV